MLLGFKNVLTRFISILGILDYLIADVLLCSIPILFNEMCLHYSFNFICICVWKCVYNILYSV